MDTVIRGFPVPLIFLRERVTVSTVDLLREVVDGQQRLRTLFAFIDPSLLKDYDPNRDSFTIRRTHNADYADKTFRQLPESVQRSIGAYPFSVLVLPSSVEDRDILQMFARINSTGQTLNHQELRNAAWFGAFKTVAYRLAYEQLDRWRRWGIFSEEQIARMQEVETTSDLMLNIISGLSGKSQAKLDNVYRQYNDSFPHEEVVSERFRAVMDNLDDVLGPIFPRSVYRGQVYFFTVFVFFYDLMYGLGSPLAKAKPSRLPSDLRDKLIALGHKFQTADVPEEVLDAVRRASADFGRRETRLNYMRATCLRDQRRS